MKPGPQTWLVLTLAANGTAALAVTLLAAWAWRVWGGWQAYLKDGGDDGGCSSGCG